LAKPFSINEVVPYVFGIEDAVIGPTGIIEFDASPISDGPSSGSFHIWNSGSQSRTVTFSITRSDHGDISIPSSFTLAAGERAEVEVGFPGGNFAYLSADIQMAVEGETLDFGVWMPDGESVSASNDKFYVNDITDAFEIRTNDANDALVMRVFTSDTNNDFQSIFRGTLTGVKCDISYDVVQEDGLWGININHRVYNPTGSTVEMMLMYAHHDWLSLTAGNQFTTEVQQNLYRVVTTDVTGSTQTAEGGSTGGTGIFMNQGVYPNTLLIPAFIYQHRGVDNGDLGYDIKYSESWVIHKEIFGNNPKRLRFVHGRSTGGGAGGGATGWRKILEWEQSPNLTGSVTGPQEGEFGDLYELEPGEEWTFTLMLKFDTVTDEVTGDFSWIDRYRRIHRAFAGDIKYNPNFEGRLNLSGSFGGNPGYNTNVASTIADGDGWRYVDTVPAVDALFDAGVDTSQIAFATLNSGEAERVRVASREAHPPDNPVPYLQSFDGPAFFLNPDANSWYVDIPNNRMYVNFGSGLDLSGFTNLSILDDTNPWFFVSTFPERVGGWQNFIDASILPPHEDRGWNSFIIRRITGEPWRHIGMSPAAFADAANPEFFPVSAATINEMIDFLADNPDIAFSGWWGRSTRMTEDFYTTDAEQIYHDNGEESRLREARELNALIEWGWEGCGFDAFPDQSYALSYPRIQYLREIYGPDFYMAEEPNSCDVMAVWTQQWVVESKIFTGAESDEPIGDLSMMKFLVPRCEFVAQTRAGFGDANKKAITEASIAWLYENGFRPEIYANSSVVENQVDSRPNRPTKVPSIDLDMGLTLTTASWVADENGYTDEFLVEISRNTSFTDLIARGVLNSDETEFSFTNESIQATDEFIYARVIPSNDSYVGEATIGFMQMPEDDDGGDDGDGGGSSSSDGPITNAAIRPTYIQRPVGGSVRVQDINLFGFYRPTVQSKISSERTDIAVDAFMLGVNEVGIFPLAGPHQLLDDDTWISRHEERVKSDIITKVRNRSYNGLLLVDYSNLWHPVFEYSSYATSDGYFTDDDFDDMICSSGKLFDLRDKNYREDFYNYWYCSDPDTVTALDPDTELEPFMKSSWDSICREFYEATIRGIKAAVPDAQIGFVDLPRAIYKDKDIVTAGPGIVGYGSRFDTVSGDTYNTAQSINNQLSWLWEQVDILAPFIKARRYSVPDDQTPQSGIENARTTNASYISSNTLEAHRLHALYSTAFVVPVFEHVYSSLPPYTRLPLNEINMEQQLTVPFASGANSVAFMYDQPDDVQNYVSSDYANEFNKFLPSDQMKRLSGGNAFRPIGGLSSTGADRARLTEIDSDALGEFFPPLALFSTSAGPFGGIDRRPVRVYTMWEDGYLSSSGQSNAFISWWLESGGVANLIERMTADYKLGYRRFMFYMPAGNQTASAGYYSPNQWETIVSSRQTEISVLLSDWVQNQFEEVEIIVMGGIRMNGDLSKLDTHMIDYDNAVPYDLANNSVHGEYFSRNYQPWVDAGASSVALHDACDSDVGNRFVELVGSQFLAEKKIYGSCLPLSDAETIDEGLIGLTSWILPYDQFLDLQGSNVFIFDEATTEMGVVLTAQMSFTQEDLSGLEGQGLVLYVAEGTVADEYLFGSGSSEEEVNTEAQFVTVQGPGTDPIEGFGVVRYNPVNAAVDGEDPEPIYAQYDLVAVANSVNGVFALSAPLTKRDILTVDITNPSFDNTSLPHAVVEDSFEWVNSGLPSHLSQTRDSNLLQMGLNMTRTNPGAMEMVPPYQAKYILPCNNDVYDVFNSTVDFEILADFGRRNFSLPYATAVTYVRERNEVWVGGPGGVLSIDATTYEVDEVRLDNRRELQIKDMFSRNGKVYVLDQTALYIYDLETDRITRDPGLGWPSDVFEFINFFNTNLAVGASDGIYARRELQDTWTKVQDTGSLVNAMIAPDAGFAIADNEVHYTTDGFTWTLIGTASQDINSLVKYRNRIYLATDQGIYEDGGFFYAERVSLRLVDVFNDSEESRDIVANDIASSNRQVVSGLDDGRLVTIDDFGFTVFDSGLDTIHKVAIVGDEVSEDVWMFSYNTFKIKSQTQLRRLVSGQRL
jgi:hypothetical protein